LLGELRIQHIFLELGLLREETTMMTGGAGKSLKIVEGHAVAVYDPKDGRVVHMHHVIVFEGGKSVSAEQAQKEAVEAVKRRGLRVENVKTLRADLPAEPAGRFKVDVDKKKLIALKPPARIPKMKPSSGKSGKPRH
jgi:hypothetical protein